MMNKGKIWIIISLLIIVKVFLGVTYLQIGEIQSKVWLVTSNKTNLLTEQNLRELNLINEQQHEKLDYVFWKEIEGNIIAPKVNREEYCNIILASERIDILFQDSVPFDPKRNECIMSRTLADKLFGSDNVEGLSVEHGGRIYQIREVSESLEEGIVIFTIDNLSILDEKKSIDKKETILFENITILNNGSISDSAIKDKLESFLGIQLKRLDLKFEFFVIQLAYIISIFILVKIINVLLKNKIKTNVIIFILLIFAVDLFIIFHFYNIPADIIPSRLSDKLFWHDLYNFEKENYRYLFTMKRVIPLRSWYKLRIWLILLLLINVMLLFKLYRLCLVKKQ